MNNNNNNNRLISLLLLLLSTTFSLADIPPKEHKVHNIVLYPDKHSWCKVTPIKQVISQPGCQSKSVDNNVCVGTCFSFSVPRTIPETPGDEQLHYCDSCQSSDSTWINVSLECEAEDGDSSQTTKIEKSVEIIGNCSCMSCKDRSSNPPPQSQRVQDEDMTEYEDEGTENLKMYDIAALKHAALQNRNAAAAAAAAAASNSNHVIGGSSSPSASSGTGAYNDGGKRLPLQEDPGQEMDEDLNFRQVKSLEEE